MFLSKGHLRCDAVLYFIYKKLKSKRKLKRLSEKLCGRKSIGGLVGWWVGELGGSS